MWNKIQYFGYQNVNKAFVYIRTVPHLSVYLQHNVMLYIQKSVSENAGIAVIGVEKFSGGEYPRTPPPTIKCDTTPNVLLPTTIYHFSTLGIVWSLFVDAPPPHRLILKKCPAFEIILLRFYLRKHLYTLRGWRQRFIKLAGDYWATIIKT